MFNRRSVMFGLTAVILAPQTALAAKVKNKFVLDAKFMPQLVDFPSIYAIGSVVVDPKNRFLYLVEATGVARRYGVGVGRAGLAWSGTAEVARKAKWPSWTPTKNMIKRSPEKYGKYAGGVAGGPSNPLGSRALYLYRKREFPRTLTPSFQRRSLSDGRVRADQAAAFLAKLKGSRSSISVSTAR
ncbi:L,D-transpeptidase [Mesorhizobium qingshengii]|uniref:L,D-transpeptidase n=1 Tax=Mesorhizobium qingshengii TaxID=1165689 RepID=A0ABT4R304_9HYPH|nr:L,D-transpeptidase [Mesorhizobium qingshengii]MCZ8548210.1 L,D-transpeptidase [Mesorhizobium qingshengii]